MGAVADELAARFDAENARLPSVLRENDIGYFLIPTSMLDERDRVAQSLRAAVTALRLFALVAAGAAVVLALVSALRVARREQAHQDVWRQLGVTRRQRFLAIALPVAAGAGLGLVGAVALGFVGSGIGAVASARALEPDRRFALSREVFLGVASGATVALLTGVAAIAWTMARSRAASPVLRPSTLLHMARAVHPSRGVGMRAATAGPGAATVLVGSVAAVLAVLASLVFAASVNGLVDTPARYGWPYDVGVIIGFGYGGADTDAIAASLDHPDVERWGLAALGSVTVEGQALATVAEREHFAALRTPLIDGEHPDGPGEIALGAESADDLDVDIGDTVSVATHLGEAEATVTGVVVLPPVGPYQSDRAATGTGVLISERFYADLVASAEEAQGIPPGSLSEIGIGSFLAIELASGVDVDDFVASIDARQRLAWDRNGFEPFFYPEPVRPAVIADVASLGRLPIGLGGFFALAMAGGLATGIAVATRGRQRELAILGALGCTPRQLASSVRWHALTVAAIVVCVGVPLGVAVGRVLYRNFAVNLGVLPTIATSTPAIAGVAAGTVLVGLLASALPGHRVSTAPLSLSPRGQ